VAEPGYRALPWWEYLLIYYDICIPEKQHFMKIRFIVIGKTEEEYLRTGINLYLARLRHYISFEYLELPALKNASSLSMPEQKTRERELVLKHIQSGEHIVLLDEHGKQMKSAELAGFLNRKMVSGIKSLVFVVGGPFGFDPSMKNPDVELISLSKLTFSHQMVRLIFAEQLYRAFTILRNEAYHHE